MTTNNTELFTELTPEQSATVEGGSLGPYFVLHEITARKSDEGNGDDVYMKYNGKRQGFKLNGMKTGTSRKVNFVGEFNRRVQVDLYDSDTLRDDHLATFTIRDQGRNQVFIYSHGTNKAGQYRIDYSVLSKRQP